MIHIIIDIVVKELKKHTDERGFFRELIRSAKQCEVRGWLFKRENHINCSKGE